MPMICPSNARAIHPLQLPHPETHTARPSPKTREWKEVAQKGNEQSRRGVSADDAVKAALSGAAKQAQAAQVKAFLYKFLSVSDREAQQAHERLLEREK